MTLLPILWKKGDIAMTISVSDSMALPGKFACKLGSHPVKNHRSMVVFLLHLKLPW